MCAEKSAHIYRSSVDVEREAVFVTDHFIAADGELRAQEAVVEGVTHPFPGTLGLRSLINTKKVRCSFVF